MGTLYIKNKYNVYQLKVYEIKSKPYESIDVNQTFF